MSTSKPQTSSSDIELPVLTSSSLSIQTPPERVPFSSPISEANSIAIMVDEVEPPTPAYFPPSNDIPPLPYSDIGLLEYTQLHGHSDNPLSPRQREDDRTPASGASLGEALPAYRVDNLPKYSLSLGRRGSKEPLTWPAISFRIGFLCPLFWLIGALTLITPQGLLDGIFMPWFKDFAPTANSWLETLATEAEKEEYLARVRVSERKWAKRCLFAFSVLLIIVGATVGTAIK